MQKKKSINAIYFMMGIFLVSGLLPFTSSAGYDWNTYGNGYTPSHNAQYETGYSAFDGAINTLTSTSSGQDQFDYSTQALVDEFGDFDTNYMAVADGNYLRLFDGDLDFYTEAFVGMNSMGQLASTDWNSDGHTDIAGFWRYNATQLHFKVFSPNHTLGTLDEIYDYNVSFPSTNGVTGVRCEGNTCYTVLFDNALGSWTWTHLEMTPNGTTSYQVASGQADDPIDPPSWVDYDNNGDLDFIVFSDNLVLVYDENGIGIQNWTRPYTTGSYNYIKHARFIDSDASPYWRLVFVYEIPYQSFSSGQCAGNYACVRAEIRSVNDGSSITAVEPLSAGSSSGGNPRLQGFAIKDYGSAEYQDVWIATSRIGSNRVGLLSIYEGDGTSLYSSSSLGDDYGNYYPRNSMTLARMDDDSSYDAIILSSGNVRVWSPATDSMLYSGAVSGISDVSSCVPADLNFDGSLDLACADTNSVALLSPNVTNSNPYITQVAYDPSTLVAVNETLTAIISATDDESNNILYSHKCNSTVDWSSEDSSNTKDCVYDTVGSYTLTVGVRDSFHGDYTTFPQTITVTSTGAVCDNDFVCEAEQGETYLSCPNDCDSPEETQIPDSTTATGGLPVPTQLVDVDDTNKGLLPEIYYGTMGFMSSVLSPTILLVFVIFFAMIMLTIGGIIRKIAQRVSDNAR